VEKGYRELFAAAEQIRRSQPAVRWLVAGPEEPSKADALSAEELDAARATGIELLGFRSDPERLYQALDVYVLASHREGWPRSAMEAAACGLPVVATDIRGCRQVVVDGDTGLLFPPGDAAALAARLLELLADPARRRAMGTAAVALSQERFDQEKVIEVSLDAYRRQGEDCGTPSAR
jgi:glycosyltransferase involved in cell wall biosynthesis